MESRQVKISFNKSGRGSMTPKLTLPMAWIKQMGIEENDRDVRISFDEGKIIIEKLTQSVDKNN